MSSAISAANVNNDADDSIGAGDAALVESGSVRQPGQDLTNHDSKAHRRTPSYASTNSSAHAQLFDGKPPSSIGHGRPAGTASIPLRSSSVNRPTSSGDQGQARDSASIRSRGAPSLDGPHHRASSPTPSDGTSAASSIYEDSQLGHGRGNFGIPSSSTLQNTSRMSADVGKSTRGGAESAQVLHTIEMTGAIRALLESQREEAHRKAMQIGTFGQGLLDEVRTYENLMEELGEEVNMLEMVREDNIFASPKRSNFPSKEEEQKEREKRDQMENERIKRLKERIEAEVGELKKRQDTYYKDLWRQSGMNIPDGALGDASFQSNSSDGVLSAPVGTTHFSFLNSDPAPSQRDSSSSNTLGSTSKQADRRSRNAAASGNEPDKNFVSQIEQSLISQLRASQAENQRLMDLLRANDKEYKARIEELENMHALEEHKLKVMIRDQGELPRGCVMHA